MDPSAHASRPRDHREQDSASGAADPASPYAQLSPERLEALARGRESIEAADPQLDRQRVLAVLVVHDGARWLPEVVSSIRSLTRRPDAVVVVDTGSTDTSLDEIDDVADTVVSLPRTTAFGAAVAAGFDAAVALHPATGLDDTWLWVLHDDCAPEPDALVEMLRAARRLDAQVVAPKVVSWDDPGRLLELGVTIATNGARVTGIDPGERDVGQFDTTRRVLAAGSAGMLVSARTWRELDGFDDDLPFFRDDVDFGWRTNAADGLVVTAPRARVRHAQAAARGLRPISGRRQPLGLDRRHASAVVLDNAAPPARPLVALRLLWGAAVRSVLWVLGRDVAGSLDEARALGWALNPARGRAARSRRRAAVRVPRSSYRELFPGVESTLRHAVTDMRAMRRGEAPTVLVADHTDEDRPPEDTEVDLGGSGAPRAAAPQRRPLVGRAGFALLVGLLALSLLAARDLFGEGTLTGGALLPAPPGASDAIASYVAGWHPIGIGDGTAAWPWAGVLAVLSVLTLGNVPVLVDLLLLLSVPAVAAAAWLATRDVVIRTSARVWAAATYGVLPVTTGAVAAGQLGAVAVMLVAPFAVRQTALALGGPGSGLGARRHAWAAAIAVAVMSAFVPAVWLAVAFGCLLGTVVVLVHRPQPGRSRLSMLGRLGIVVAVPPLLLLPFTAEVTGDPSLLAAGFGMPGPGLAEPAASGWQLLALFPGGPGSSASWVLAGVTLLAVLSSALLLSPGRPLRWVAVFSWCVALPALGVALWVSRTLVSVPSLAETYPGWPGGLIAIAGAAVVLVAATGAERAWSSVSTRLAGVRRRASQAVVGGVVVMAALGTAVALVSWTVDGAGSPLERRTGEALPPYVVDEAESPQRLRTIVLAEPASTAAPAVADPQLTDQQPAPSFTVLRESTPTLLDAPLGPSAADYSALGDAVGLLVAGQAPDVVTTLRDHGIAYVQLAAPSSADTADTIDRTPGLTRVSAPEEAVMWRVSGRTSRVWLAGDGPRVPVPAGQVGVDTALPDPGRPMSDQVVVLAEQADTGWVATLDDQPLVPTLYRGWAQAFELPPSAAAGQRLVVEFESTRSRWVAAQALLVLIAVVMSLPRADRRHPVAAEAPGAEIPSSRGETT